MLKALINQGEEDAICFARCAGGYFDDDDLDDFHEDYEPEKVNDEDEIETAEGEDVTEEVYEGDKPENVREDNGSEDGYEEEKFKEYDEEDFEEEWDFESDDEDMVAYNERCGERLRNFYGACVKVFSEKEGVAIDDVPAYLGKKIYDGLERCYRDERTFVENFKEVYERKSDSLCSYLFSEGCLERCDCCFERFFRFADVVINGPTFEEAAENYLYGEKRFFGEEKYAGSFTIDAKKKY